MLSKSNIIKIEFQFTTCKKRSAKELSRNQDYLFN